MHAKRQKSVLEVERKLKKDLADLQLVVYNPLTHRTCNLLLFTNHFIYVGATIATE
jgi:hypothetical protein